LSDGETLRFSYGVQYFDLRRLRKILKWPVPILFVKILHIFRFFYFKEMRGWLRVSFPPWRDCNCQAGDDRSLAPRWISGVLALAVTQWCWQTEGLGRTAKAHWRDEPREPWVYRKPYPR
jgi:hypothetical protein